MDLSVGCEVGLGRERLAARLARMLRVARVHVVHVALEAAQVAKLFATEAAVERLVG